MWGRFIVNEQSAFMYLEKDKECEVTDELLFGTKVDILEKNEKGRSLCITEYGYKGYLDIKALVPSRNESKFCLVVTDNFCPIYTYKQSRIRPCKVLLKGSKIYSDYVKYDGEYMSFRLDDTLCFAGSCHLSDAKKLYAYSCQDKKRRQIVSAALSYIGTPYVWAGKSPCGIDCSGLCFMAYGLCGVGLYRDAEFDGRYVRKITKDKLKAADLIYYSGHVAMYLGDGFYIHSSGVLGGVTINSFDKSSRIYYPRLDGNEICYAQSLMFD